MGFDPAAIEEIRDVRVLLGFGAVELSQTQAADYVGEAGLRHLWCKGIGQYPLLVVGHHAADPGPWTVAAVEALEAGQAQRIDDLLRAVLAEIEADRLVLTGHGHEIGHQHRLDEFIALAGVVGGVDRGLGRRRLLSLAVYPGAPGQLCALPALVAVHGGIAPGEAGDGAAGRLQQRFDVLDVGQCGLRCGVAAVADEVQQRARALYPAQFDERDQVAEVAVHAAVRDQTEQVHGPVAGGRALRRADQDRVAEKRSVRDGGTDVHDVLADDAGRAEDHVADLGIAHQAVRQADAGAGGLQRGVREAGEVAVEVGCFRQLDRVVPLARVDPEAVEDDQHDRSSWHTAWHRHGCNYLAEAGRCIARVRHGLASVMLCIDSQDPCRRRRKITG